MKQIALIAFLLITQFAIAGDHALTHIKGKNIELKSFDHAIAGSIKDFVVFGNTDEGKNLSELIMKKDGQIIKASFGMSDGHLSGRIIHESSSGRHETRVKFTGLDTQLQKIFFEVNGSPVEVQINSERFENNHFINPQYSVTLSDSEKFDFEMKSGGACYMASIHLTMLVIASYVH